jgi:uncharacterized protein YjbJ (UPF0337 family)
MFPPHLPQLDVESSAGQVARVVEPLASGYRSLFTNKGIYMSFFNKAKNKAQSAKGHMKETTGRVTDDRSLESEGKADQLKGDLKQAGEKVRDAGEKVRDAFKQ